MIQFHVYPGGKKRIVTFSYDDGHPNDVRLIELFDKYGVKGTFHLNSKTISTYSDDKLAEIKERYKNHEISCHTVSHGWPARIPMPSLVGEIMENRKVLEKIAGYPVIGMSYPSGSFSDDAVAVHRACGIVYSRTTLSTGKFLLPEDFLRWHPTCHHKDALPLCENFLADIDSQWTFPLFYIWGHSHELKTEENWAHIEAILKALSNNEKIWYATNIEIYNYMTAQKQLQISVDERTFYNPTAIDVWVERNKEEIIHIPAGQTVKI